MKISTKSTEVIITVNPSPKQIQNAQHMGWEYLGEGYFAKGNIIGYFTNQGFKAE